MSDYSEAEHDALEHTFPGVKVYLCDFHCKQCWEWWVQDSKHNLTKEQGQQLLEYLQECTQALPGSPDDNTPQEFYYQKAVDRLKNHNCERIMFLYAAGLIANGYVFHRYAY